MGVVFYARAAIGILVTHEQIFKKKKIKVGDHNFDENTLFNPTTGARLWCDTYIRIDAKEDGSWDEHTFRAKWSFPIISGTITESRKSQVFVICCCKPVVCGSYSFSETVPVDCLALPLLKAQLKEAIEPLWLWDESKFGLHVMPYCSY